MIHKLHPSQDLLDRITVQRFYAERVAAIAQDHPDQPVCVLDQLRWDRRR